MRFTLKFRTDPVKHPGQYCKQYSFGQFLVGLFAYGSIVLVLTLALVFIFAAINVMALVIAALLLGLFAEVIVVWGSLKLWLVGSWEEFPKSIQEGAPKR